MDPRQDVVEGLYVRATNGDADALEELVQAYLPRLRAFVRVRLGSGLQRREASSDVVQSICRELFGARECFEFRGEAQFRGWLFTAALNKIREKHRRHHQARRDLGRELSQGDRPLGMVSDGAAADPLYAAIAKENAHLLESALDRLGEGDREVIALARLAGIPLTEIAARSERTPDAVRKQLGRALLRLSREIERLAGEASG